MTGYTEEELIYICGFFDGEGCVCCSWNEKKGAIKSMHLTISGTDDEQIAWLQSKLGGSITRKEHTNKNWKPSNYLQICGDNAYKFARDALKYTKIKRERLAVACVYFEARGQPKSREASRFLYDEIRRLNKTGQEAYIGEGI